MEKKKVKIKVEINAERSINAAKKTLQLLAKKTKNIGEAYFSVLFLKYYM